jgi:RNA polymerase sigma-70 factor (ECF subfamily)
MINERRPCFDPSDEERRRVTERFFAALAGDVSDIAAVLAEDVVMHGDGGGKVPAIARPARGRDRVSRLWANWAKQGMRVGGKLELTAVNGQPGAILRTATGEVISVMSLDIVDGKVNEIRNVLNPDKLGHVGPAADLTELLRLRRSSSRT